ncbi:hypothetical protein H8E88_25200 [candidate division KSB1 bacterium]|nr:hypothetical protein [candidate division KSB1 bacterium]
MKLGKYSIGIGDRFARQGKAQLNAIIKAKELGVEITPVWNKSFREHQVVKSNPLSTRKEADDAVKLMNWQHSYFVDADHVGLKNIDFFIDCSDLFTLDVADFIGQKAETKDIQSFVEKYEKYAGNLKIPGIEEEFQISEKEIKQIAEKYLFAVQEAGKTFRHILTKKDKDTFVVEVSMDETVSPQTPVELLFILAAIAEQKIPVQTIAPKFTGRFNKGVDYVGDLEQFAKEFEQDVAIINFATKKFNLPENLKLSVHSGSDKFSIYRPIKNVLKKFNAGVHLKTAGTTWLEELIGLAEAGGNGLEIAKEIYIGAFSRYDELEKPYAAVIDIDSSKLPEPDEVKTWDGKTYADTLRHDQSHELYNSNFRQLLHVAYKVAAEMGETYLSALKKNEEIVAKNVTENIFERHLKLLFL